MSTFVLVQHCYLWIFQALESFLSYIWLFLFCFSNGNLAIFFAFSTMTLWNPVLYLRWNTAQFWLLMLFPPCLYFAHWLNNEHFQYDVFSFPMWALRSQFAFCTNKQTNKQRYSWVFHKFESVCPVGPVGESDLFQLSFLDDVFSNCGPQNPISEPFQKFRKKNIDS